MTPDNAAEHRLNASTALLVLSDSTTLDYLQNILQFIDCDVHVPESPQDMQRLVQRFNDRSGCVLLSGQLADESQSQNESPLTQLDVYFADTLQGGLSQGHKGGCFESNSIWNRYDPFGFDIP